MQEVKPCNSLGRTFICLGSVVQRTAQLLRHSFAVPFAPAGHRCRRHLMRLHPERRVLSRMPGQFLRDHLRASQQSRKAPNLGAITPIMGATQFGLRSVSTSPMLQGTGKFKQSGMKMADVLADLSCKTFQNALAGCSRRIGWQQSRDRESAKSVPLPGSAAGISVIIEETGRIHPNRRNVSSWLARGLFSSEEVGRSDR